MSTSSTGRRLPVGLGLAGVALAALFVVVPLTGDAAAPPYSKAKIDCPRMATAGEQVTISGTGFPALRPVALTLDGSTTVGSATTNASGAFVATATLSGSVAPGHHLITAQVIGGGGSVVRGECRVKVTEPTG